MTSLDSLKVAYTTAVEAMIDRHPAQEQNRAHYLGWRDSAKLGRTTRRIRTKGGFTDIPKGTLVLWTPDQFADEMDRPGTLEIWAPRNDGGETKTLVDGNRVEAVCSLCEGSGMVYPHPEALVAMRCPAC